ncbi:MAG: hypothetical protein PHC53_02300 [Patescibacteria group bacterium]|nr:hypothetical protein [Patescibacteria group bacterium]
MDKKIAVMFSGGKDSCYALQSVLKTDPIEFMISVISDNGDTHLHAGPEIDSGLRQIQLELLGLPYKIVKVGSGENYLHELFVALNKLVKENGITHLVTGDLWHPYTTGIGDMLAGALGVKIIRPAREACASRSEDTAFMEKVLASGVRSVIISVRDGDLPKEYVGREIDEPLIQKLVSLGVDAAAEGGEYQSFVVSCPLMKNQIVIDDFRVDLVDGKNGKERFHRMFVNRYHVV